MYEMILFSLTLYMRPLVVLKIILYLYPEYRKCLYLLCPSYILRRLGLTVLMNMLKLLIGDRCLVVRYNLYELNDDQQYYLRRFILIHIRVL